MILDSRIKEGKRPLTCYDIDEAEGYLGKMCYMSDNYDFFRNLDLTQQKILNGVEDCEEPFHYDQDKQAEFCLPCEWVQLPKAPEFEQYTLDTWEQEFEPGDVIIFRRKENTFDEEDYFKFLYSGYVKHPDNCIRVVLGPWLFSFDELLTYQINRDGNWEPFGRKVETIDLNVI